MAGAMLYDVFICHASEDKEDLVRPIAEALSNENVVVWYDEFELRPGDSLRESIDRGLARSRHGIVVLSPAFFSKRWPQWELNGLVARQMRGEERVIIPLWHGVTRDQVVEYSPPLGDLVAIPTNRGIREVCRAIAKTVHPQESALVVARDELLAWGVRPPVITDEWWLDVIEASNRMPAVGAIPPERSVWGRWTFPLPNEDSHGEDRGVRLAWTAMQLNWTDEAEKRKITQITPPQDVLAFIAEMPGLRTACDDYPVYLAGYAPQLTIPGLGGDFEKLFDRLLGTNAARDELILRSGPPETIRAAHAACQFVQGSMWGPKPGFYETFDCLVWLLAADSQWMPERYRELLRRGMREWSTWARADLGRGPASTCFLEWFWSQNVTDEAGLPPSEVLGGLEEMIEESMALTGVRDQPSRVMAELLKGGYIKAALEDRWSSRRLPGSGKSG